MDFKDYSDLVTLICAVSIWRQYHEDNTGLTSMSFEHKGENVVNISHSKLSKRHFGTKPELDNKLNFIG